MNDICKRISKVHFLYTKSLYLPENKTLQYWSRKRQQDPVY